MVCDGCHGAHVHSSTGVSECVKTTDRNKVNQYDILFICQNKVLFRKSWPVWTEVCVKGYLKTLVPLCVFPAHRSRSLSCPVAQGCENLWQTYQRVSLIIVHLTHTHTHQHIHTPPTTIHCLFYCVFILQIEKVLLDLSKFLRSRFEIWRVCEPQWGDIILKHSLLFCVLSCWLYSFGLIFKVTI